MERAQAALRPRDGVAPAIKWPDAKEAIRRAATARRFSRESRGFHGKPGGSQRRGHGGARQQRVGIMKIQGHRRLHQVARLAPCCEG
jgi:hypothetical protein